MPPRGLRECAYSLEVSGVSERAEHLPLAEYTHHAHRRVVRQEPQLARLESEDMCEKHDHRGAVADHDRAFAGVRLCDVGDRAAHSVDDAGRQFAKLKLSVIAKRHLHLDETFVYAHFVGDRARGFERTAIRAGVDGRRLRIAHSLRQALGPRAAPRAQGWISAT